MRPSREIKKNRAFKNALRAGIIIILILSFFISWVSVLIIRAMDGNIKKEENMKEITSKKFRKDTIFIEKIKEIKKTDTIYKYIQPPAPTRLKIENIESSKEDTLSR
jgi:uncharacterized membrane protein